jgi:hypothetical protein
MGFHSARFGMQGKLPASACHRHPVGVEPRLCRSFYSV